MTTDQEPLRLFMVAGEHSGDQLGGHLIEALHEMSARPLSLSGVGGEAMEAQGCKSLFALSEIAVMGPAAILRRLPTLIRRVHETVDAAVAMRPDALVILDSPEFTHAVAKRVRRRLPDLPVIDYVSPSVWAWRPGRARRMRRYIDHVLAILPFEPEAHLRLGGPDCTYIGHPLIERLEWIRSRDGKAFRRKLGVKADQPLIAVLPGSRATEVNRLMGVFGKTIARILSAKNEAQVVIPAAPGIEHLIERHLQDWPIKPHIVTGREDRFTAFRAADAALAASGTVTLELALAQTPMVVAYRMEAVVAMFMWMLKAHSIVLPNLVLGENIFPEYVHGACNADNLSGALLPLLDKSSPEFKRQIEALKGLDENMRLPSGTPSTRAARIVLDLVPAVRTAD
ncbi:MAG: lipid-A-disaccharide synthase [Hyphomicrobiaceae bacterium]|nr:lipid-A-disaccharide synthase [Hyphomicrobiaceae bacterium]